MTFQVFINGVDYTVKTVSTRREYRSSMVDALEIEVFQPTPADVDTGKEVILKQGATTVFEGIIYEKHLEYTQDAPQTIRHARLRAYSKLILYENQIVTRTYDAGTSAADIITDLANTISGVTVHAPSDTPTLNQVWEIQNRKAYDVMRDVVRGIDYMLFMRPGLHLYLKKKEVGTPVKTFDVNNTIYIQNNEDNWATRNRVIYLGENDQVLTDVSEPPGDRPIVIRDPFLTDPDEAQRRANTWLNKLKHTRQEIRLTVEKQHAENLDLGDTVTVNFPDIGVNNKNMFVVGIEFPFDVKEPYANIIVGGELEFFERMLDELEGRDPTSLFGGGTDIAEVVGSLNAIVTSLQAAQRIQAWGRTVRAYNVPPMFYENGVNITLDQQGRITLMSNATSGSFEFPWKPNSPLFTRWLRTQYLYTPNDGSVSADILLPDGTTLFSNIPDDFEIPYLPPARGVITNTKDGWELTNATVEETQMGIVGFVALRFTKTADPMKLVWPKDKNANLDILRFLRLYIYTFNTASITIRLYEDDNNYMTATINNTGGAWMRWDISTASMTKTGSPDKMNWLEITTSANVLYLDTDYLLYPAQDERLRLKITLSRPNLTSTSPTINMAKWVWREGKT